MRKRDLAVRMVLLGAVASSLSLGGVAAGQVVERRPNLKALPAHDITLYAAADGRMTLLFSATSWNAGQGPLELRRGEASAAGQNVYQRIYRSDGTFHDRLAGTFAWHPDHDHFHFEEYALYTLQPVSAPGGSQRISSKTSFCVADTTAVDLSLPSAPPSPRYATCEPLVQGMSVGWGDEYYYLLGGQSFDFSGNPSGAYDLVIEVDPRGRLVETDESDNVSCVRVDVDVTRRTVAVLGACDGALPGGGAGGGTGGTTEVVVSSIAPNTASEDSVVGVTIKGSGFAAGTAVTFENGTGPRPVATDVVVDDASTIRATVTVPAKRGKSRVRTWDVRVGSGVLVDGFTVVPR